MRISAQALKLIVTTKLKRMMERDKAQREHNTINDYTIMK